MCSPNKTEQAYNHEGSGRKTGEGNQQTIGGAVSNSIYNRPEKQKGIGEIISGGVGDSIPKEKTSPGYQGVGRTLGGSPMSHRTLGRSSRGAGLNPRRQSAKGKTILTGSLA